MHNIPVVYSTSNIFCYNIYIIQYIYIYVYDRQNDSAGEHEETRWLLNVANFEPTTSNGIPKLVVYRKQLLN